MTPPANGSVPVLEPVTTPAGEVALLVDGADMDCGSGLLLLITRAMRRLEAGQLLGIRSAEHSVVIDLPVWAELVGHVVDAQVGEGSAGPWWFVVRKRGETSQAGDIFETDTVFSVGSRTPVGQRLWVYSNFNCNLACDYCCAESSPRADARRFPPALAREVFPEFEGTQRTLLTNAMIFNRGTRRDLLESLDRSVTLQVSLDSATAALHDRQRGAGSWERALAGVGLARSLGFRVRVAATLYDEDPTGVEALHLKLDEEGIDRQDRIIRPVAEEGFAEGGVHVSIDSLEPEPTLTVDGAWWHPVAVTNPNMRIAEAPLPLAEVFGVIRDTVSVQDAATRTGREVFRCA